MKRLWLAFVVCAAATCCAAEGYVHKIHLHVPSSKNRKNGFPEPITIFPNRLTHLALKNDFSSQFYATSSRIKIDGIVYEWVWVDVGSGAYIIRSALYKTGISRTLWRICDIFSPGSFDSRIFYWDSKAKVITNVKKR